MSGGFDFLSQYYIYLYILYIYIYTHPKFCISHRQKILRFALFFPIVSCTSWVNQMVVARELRQDDSQMSKEKGGDGDKPNEMFLDPKVSAAV